MSQSVQDNSAPAIGKRMYATGPIVFLCQHCGAVNGRRVRPSTWRVKCSNGDCRRVITWTTCSVPVGYAFHSPVTAMAGVAP